MLLDMIRRAIGAAASADPGLAAAGGVRRSSKWPGVRSAHLKARPACEACGKREALEVHHIQPFNLRPDLELDPTNLMTLCGDPCHIVHGHLMGWARYNPTARTDVRLYRTNLESAKLAARGA
jgi:5-methylcytosine-specific restriction endonuclease McrA